MSGAVVSISCAIINVSCTVVSVIGNIVNVSCAVVSDAAVWPFPLEVFLTRNVVQLSIADIESPV